MNSSSHRPLHHLSNLEYIDKNFGGVNYQLQFFQNIYERKRQPFFDLAETKNINSPFKLILLKWKLMVVDFKDATFFTVASK
jgi:hypothetical protein